MSLHLSTVILPYRRWHDGGSATWRRAEELGFRTAYTYDHLSWRSFHDGPWFGAMPTLTAAAGITERVRLGALVASPNFRHPVPLAKELISLDDISGGRITLGIGAGANGFDARALGQEPWTPGERANRFAEFVSLLDGLLTEDTANGLSYAGQYFSACGARNIPGCVQRPRLPFAVAATGPRGLRLAARYGQAWVTMGDPKLYKTGTPEQSRKALRDQVEKLGEACTDVNRDADAMDKILLTGYTPDSGLALKSLDAFVDFVGEHRRLGFTEIVIHWPILGSDFTVDESIFERIATDTITQLG